MTQWIISSSLLIAAVLFIRAIAGDRLSARLRYALWGLVLLRLLIPGSIGESDLSVRNWMLNETAPVVQNVQVSEPVENVSVGETVTLPSQPVVQGEAAHSLTREEIFKAVWLLGAVLVGAVFLLSNVRFALRLRRSREYLTMQTVPVYESAAIDTPCLFGFLRPAVYITPEVMADKTAQRHVLAHELTHYRHGDHLWSLLRCVAMTLHWYNPLVWAAAIASQKDGELACDEGALRRLGNEERTDYARTLLNLTCVGYRGMLTAATSMTGSESDLKTRVKRIAKNPKMTAVAAIVVAAAMLLTGCAVFTDAKTPAIEGVWRGEISVLGVGVTEETSAYMEYEFGKGRGCRLMCVGEEVRSAEWFNYTIEGDKLTITMDDGGVPWDYTCVIKGDEMTLTRNNRDQVLTAMERKSVPYLEDGPVSLGGIFRHEDRDLEGNTPYDPVTDAQLVQLLRDGEVVDTIKERPAMDGTTYYVMPFCNGAARPLYITKEMVYDDNGETGYVLSNMDEIFTWLQAQPLVGEQFNKNMETYGFVPPDMVGITDARMIVYGKAFAADSAKLAFLEELLSTAVDMGYPTACPFEGYLEVTLSDGRVLGVVPALDSCSAFMIGDTCYEYGNQFAYDDEGSYDNTELLAVFGLNHDTLMQLWESVREPVQGEAIGGLNDQGDVIRVKEDVMEPTRLPDSTKETITAWLAEGLGDAIGEEAVDFDELYYTVLCETLGAEEGFVTLSDNGSLYMDGVRYELRTAEAILQILDAHYNELRITQDGYDMTELSGVTGEFLYVELSGVPMDSAVRWVSENEDVCTVTGDAYGAEIYITGLGEAIVSAEWDGDESFRSDSVIICGQLL